MNQAIKNSYLNNYFGFFKPNTSTSFNTPRLRNETNKLKETLSPLPPRNVEVCDIVF